MGGRSVAVVSGYDVFEIPCFVCHVGSSSYHPLICVTLGIIMSVYPIIACSFNVSK